MMAIEVKPKKIKKGLACLSPERRREIARLGGKASQATGRAHKFTSEEAKIYGRKGGSISKRTDFARRQYQQLVNNT